MAAKADLISDASPLNWRMGELEDRATDNAQVTPRRRVQRVVAIQTRLKRNDPTFISNGA